ncbi:RNA polymerase recycling motor ATPase HelR [Paenarthrobacter nicotinovorans]|uniref:RNA polymerase recycling motor ATPase HelR n=1 Tax=Paenarthrobacter nicotinovorans TaxID=29320 RepID=UPI00047D4E63|nr:RNA polymerase recycling motor ATPase HelR [Paenarthrobacter nicotinovorans]
MPETSPLKTSAFALPQHLARKADPTLIGDDEQQFEAIRASLAEQIMELSARLDAARKQPGGRGQAALDRDQEIHRITARLRTLRRFGLDLCLGRMVGADSSEAVYVGRLGLTDKDGRRLLIDWRSPAAEPFFGATHANPMGLANRRRYRWTRDRISDYWDEVFTAEGLENNAALDDQSAFIASLGSSRSPRMRDVLGTIQADQDRIIRAGSRGALVVDGGPGTGKTVVALHRTAYLLYSDPRLSHRGNHRRSDVLFVGPHQQYLAYVADVLPSLGEEGVQTCTLRDLVPEGATAVVESDPEVVRLKSSAGMVKAIERAAAFYEEPPAEGIEVETPYADVWLSSEDWAEAFDAAEAGTPHNEAREDVWDALLAILVDKLAEYDVPDSILRRALTGNGELRTAFAKAWPLLDYPALVADLWRVPAYLAMCAPWLQPAERAALKRHGAEEWTTADLPLLDAARQRLGDPEASQRKRQQAAALAAEKELMDRVVDDLIAADDSENLEMYMLRGDDMREKLVDLDAFESVDPDVLAGPFAHIVVDEAQELTDAEWQMLLLRCPSRSFTVVGDRAQARHGFTETWEQRLERVGLGAVTVAGLSINYRTPQEVMAEAEPVIRAALPDANVPRSVRSTGIPVLHAGTGALSTILDDWLGQNPEGIACVISRPGVMAAGERDRVSWLSPELSKGLEFDLVVLIDPEDFGAGAGTGAGSGTAASSGTGATSGTGGIEGAVDRYVAMTRATRQLVILRSGREQSD